MAGKYTMRSKEEKLAIVKRNLAGETSRSLERETGCSHRLIQEWTRKYLAEGEAGLEVKKKPGNPLSRYERRNELTYEEQLQYQIELLKRELVKKEAETLATTQLWKVFGDVSRTRCASTSVTGRGMI